jgi:hypothetical protein
LYELKKDTAAMKQLIRQAREHLLKLERSISMFEKVENTADLFQLERLLKKIEDSVEKVNSSDIKQTVKSWIEEKQNVIDKQKKDFGFKLVSQLESSLKNIGLSLKGSFPTLRTKFLTLKIDFNRQNITIWYGPEQEFLGVEKLHPSRVAKKIEELYNSITNRPFNENQFLGMLYTAYQRLLLWKGLKEGDKVPIIEILNELAFQLQEKDFKINPLREKYKGYGRVYFSYDLYRLGRKTYKDMILELSVATMAMSKDRSKYLWIPTNEDGNGTIYSSLTFKKVSK